MSILETKSFQLTISTKTDVDQRVVDHVRAYCEKKCVFYHVVCEHGDSGKRHLHAMLLYEQPKQKKNIQDQIWKRFVKPYHVDDGSIGAVAVKVQVAPGDDWVREYLKKEEDHEVVTSKWDEQAVQSYFPDEHTQQLLQESAGKGPADGWIASHLDDFKSSYKRDLYEGYRLEDVYEYCLKWYYEHKRDPNTRILRERVGFMHRFLNEDFRMRTSDRRAIMTDEEHNSSVLVRDLKRKRHDDHERLYKRPHPEVVEFQKEQDALQKEEDDEA